MIKKFYEYNSYKKEYDNNARLLRKLTKKSKLKFGKQRQLANSINQDRNIKDFEEATVGDLLDIFDYLYYGEIPPNFPNINFPFCSPNNICDIPIILRENHQYLRWIYFNLENITFVDDILNEIGITDQYKINKPGKNPKLFKILNDELYNNLMPTSIKIDDIKRKENDKNNKRKAVDYDQNFSKAYLQSINHGHANFPHIDKPL